MRDERRNHGRVEVEWSVDCATDETFLFASITNISALGIFVRTTSPLEIGTRVVLSFSPPGHAAFKLDGVVAWVNALRLGNNPNPGMGVRFVDLATQDRARLVRVITTLAYVLETAS